MRSRSRYVYLCAVIFVWDMHWLGSQDQRQYYMSRFSPKYIKCRMCIAQIHLKFKQYVHVSDKLHAYISTTYCYTLSWLFQVDAVIMHSRIAPVDFMHVHLLLFVFINILHRTISAKRDLEQIIQLPSFYSNRIHWLKACMLFSNNYKRHVSGRCCHNALMYC